MRASRPQTVVTASVDGNPANDPHALTKYWYGYPWPRDASCPMRARYKRVITSVLIGLPLSALWLVEPTRSLPTIYLGYDAGHSAERLPRPAAKNNGGHSVILNVFPDLGANGSEAPPQPSARPDLSLPVLKYPGAKPAPRHEPEFSPRLKPPNGRTDGKIYPA